MAILETPGLSEITRGLCIASRARQEQTGKLPRQTAPVPPTCAGKVLVVDDSPVVRGYVEEILLENEIGDEILLAESGSQGINFLKKYQVDLVLCDMHMPGLNGFDFLTRMRADRTISEIPVIMLTSEKRIQSKIECLELGASDYLLKPFAVEELIARVSIQLRLKALQDELRKKNAQLTKLARLDSLTGIPNRHDFLESLERELGRAQRRQLPLALGMVDIDHFKQVNDNYGHLCGDRALVDTTRLLKSGLRDYDYLGRYGGEEFAIVFVDSGADSAMTIAERCRRRVAENRIVLEDSALTVTVSIGVASTLEPSSGMSTELISRADEALYTAKHQGRNQVVLAPSKSTYAPGSRRGPRSMKKKSRQHALSIVGRIGRQLRGRAGRQGDPVSSRSSSASKPR